MQGNRGNRGCRQRRHDQLGQVVVLFALLLPMLLTLAAVVLAVGNWYTHAKHVQTKVDAAAFAGGTAWGFPCGPNIDSEIEGQARLYLGSHTTADGTVVTSPYNPQLSGVGPDQIYASLNQAQWWSGTFPAADFSDPLGPVCESKILDVKATEEDPPLIGSYLPFFPDIKRKARVQIEEVSGLTGLLPIAVRLPQPLSAAAIFYNENTPAKQILAVKPFRQLCVDPDDPDDPDDSFDPCIAGAPPGLGQWTTEPELGSGGTLASFEVAPQTGVVIATSVRPLCGAGSPPATQPCMDIDRPSSPDWTTKSVDEFCAQANHTVRCYDDIDGGGPSSTVSEGVHFLLGHPTGPVPPGPNLPDFRGAWLGFGSCITTVSGYFNSAPGGCSVVLNVKLNAGSCMRGPGKCFDDPLIDPPQETRRAGAGPDPFGNNIQVRYCVVQTGDVGDACEFQFSEAEELTCSGSDSSVECVSGPVPIAASSLGNAFALEVRLRNTVVTGFPDCQSPDDFKDSCRFFFTGEGYAGDSVRPLADQILSEPIHRSFMGDLERTTPVRWVRLTQDNDCDPETATDRTPDAASQPASSPRCYIVDLGVAGGLARDQDEPPIAFNLGDNSSQRAFVDCDPNLQPDPKEEIVKGCQWPPYAANKFATTPHCPGNAAGFFDPVNPPMAAWPPYTCVITQTGNSSQVIQGFNERFFGKANSPTCPDEVLWDLSNVPYAKGRNYWHRFNNARDKETFAWDGTGPLDPGGTPGAKGNSLRSDDPRLVTLFFTTYESFTNTGNEVYPIVGFGNFYVTGYGEVVNGKWKGGAPEDPCVDGNDSGVIGAGNVPPSDIDLSKNTRWVWGHFVKEVTPAPFTTGGSGQLCNPEASFQPCVAVLVE